jgi:membrane-bound ClpP family serine protease
MKLNDIAIAIAIFIIVSLILSFLNILSISFTNILSYSLITIGIALVYSEVIKQNRLLIFIGSVVFLTGIFFLITENFEVNATSGMRLPFILIFSGSGLLMVHISTPTKKIILLASVILLSAGLALLLIDSHWKLDSFIQSVLSVVIYLWPIAIIILILVLLLQTKSNRNKNVGEGKQNDN